jgi:acyl carrier protein
MKTIKKEAFLKVIETGFGQRVAGLGLNTAFRELPEWDSLTSVMLVAEIYSEHGVQVSAEEMKACRSVADLKKLVESKF